jgi:hypothetical protein
MSIGKIVAAAKKKRGSQIVEPVKNKVPAKKAPAKKAESKKSTSKKK